MYSSDVAHDIGPHTTSTTSAAAAAQVGPSLDSSAGSGIHLRQQPGRRYPSASRTAVRRPTTKPPLPPSSHGHADSAPPSGRIATTSRSRHVTFSAEDSKPSVAETSQSSLAVGSVPSTGEHQRRFVGSFSYIPNPDTPHSTITPTNASVQNGRADSKLAVQGNNPSNTYLLSESLKDEEFVDGHFFFNNFASDRDAQDFNMAEVLRERSWELHRRQMSAKGGGGHSSSLGSIGRMREEGVRWDNSRRYYPRSRPVDEFRSPPAEVPLQADRTFDVSFTGGLEVEIPPRRHDGGLGNGGINRQQSLSADSLLMVPSASTVHPHSDHNVPYHGQYIRPELMRSEVDLRPAPMSRVTGHVRPQPRQAYAAVTSGLREDTKESAAVRALQQNGLSDLEARQRYSKPGLVPLSNRYNVRTGQFEPPDHAEEREDDPTLNSPRLISRFPPKAYQSVTSAASPSQWQSSSDLSRVHHHQRLPPTNVATYQPPMQRNYPFHSSRLYPARSLPTNLSWNGHRVQHHMQPNLRPPSFSRTDPRLSESWDPGRFPSSQGSLLPMHRTRGQQLHSVSFPLVSQPQEPINSAAVQGGPSWKRSVSNLAEIERDPWHSRVDDSAGYIAPRNPSYVGSSRKVVTWEDLERQDPAILDAGRPSPEGAGRTTGFQSDQTYSEQPSGESSSRDDTRSSSKELGFSHSIHDSISRSLFVTHLEHVDQFALFEVSASKLCWSESLTGMNWLDKTKQYKFVVLNRYEEILFIGVEEESTLSSSQLSPNKSSFKVRILDANGRDVIHFRRLFPIKPQANFNIGNKKKYRLEVATPSGRVIGSVEKTFDSDTYYILEDRAGECLFLIQRSCICTCPLFWDYEFRILLPDGETEVGEVSWSYLTAQDEQFTGTEISFPVDLDVTSKVMLLGVCFLLNFSRWQSPYLDSIYNPRKRKEKQKGSNIFGITRPTLRDENKEVAALLESSPDDCGFRSSSNPVQYDEEDRETSGQLSAGTSGYRVST